MSTKTQEHIILYSDANTFKASAHQATIYYYYIYIYSLASKNERSQERIKS